VWLGLLYESQGRASDAFQEFENALRLDPKNKAAQEGRKRNKRN
jgi:cytochrome c-type biogenesis protein CcmH/NrfG